MKIPLITAQIDHILFLAFAECRLIKNSKGVKGHFKITQLGEHALQGKLSCDFDESFLAI
jgi:hypothetical protein